MVLVAQVTGRVGRCRGLFVFKASTLISLLVGFVSTTWALDPSVTTPSPTKGKFFSTLVYGHLKSTQDFDTRGEVDLKTHGVGASFGFGITDRTIVALKGGSYSDPYVESQGNTWRGRVGYFYGLDLYHQIFPTTDFLKPGVMAEVGAVSIRVPLDRLETTGATSLIDQRMSGVEYHGSLLLVWKWSALSPYLGPRVFGSSVKWHNNQPGAAGLASITGHAKGNISMVAGSSVRLTPELRLILEGRILNETVVTVGLHYAAL